MEVVKARRVFGPIFDHDLKVILPFSIFSKKTIPFLFRLVNVNSNFGNFALEGAAAAAAAEFPPVVLSPDLLAAADAAAAAAAAVAVLSPAAAPPAACRLAAGWFELVDRLGCVRPCCTASCVGYFAPVRFEAVAAPTPAAAADLEIAAGGFPGPVHLLARIPVSEVLVPKLAVAAEAVAEVETSVRKSESTPLPHRGRTPFLTLRHRKAIFRHSHPPP